MLDRQALERISAEGTSFQKIGFFEFRHQEPADTFSENAVTFCYPD